MLGKHRLVPGLAILVVTIMSLLCRDIPFFWDSSFFCAGAQELYNQGFSNLILNINTDTGGFPMYPLWMAICWTIAGKSLLVSHLAMLPWLIIVVYQVNVFAKRWISPDMLKWALLLVLLDPTFATQSVLMAYDLILCAFFLLALNALLSGKKWLFIIMTTMMLLSSVRGILLLAAVAIIHFLVVKILQRNPFKGKGFFVYIPAVIIWLMWMCWHYYQTGWFMVSPVREANHESLNQPIMMLRQGLYICWKAFDFGRICSVVFIVIMAIFFGIKKSLNRELKFLFLMILTLLIVPAVTMAPLANPVGHRYVLSFIILLPLVFLSFVSALQNKKIKIAMIVVVACVYISGNFWMYPERYGNGWDASLKVIPWFSLEKQISSDVKSMNIPATAIGSEWPVFTNPAHTTLSDDVAWCNDLDGRDIQTMPYIFQTNICNSFSPSTLLALREHWTIKKQWHKGQVYAVLYQNPTIR